MDLDALRAARQGEWQRLEQLSRHRRMDGRGSDELILRYQDAAADLSAITTTAGAVPLADRLSVTLSRARMRFTGTGANLLSQLPRFFLAQLPAALYRLRWWTLGAAAASAVVALAYGLWAANDPQVLAALGRNNDLKQLVNHDFVDYYSRNPAASFTSQVWTNNAFIAAQCIAFGIVGVYVPYLLLQNAQNIGITGGILFAYGRGDTFFLYIAPHGLLELTSVFVAGAAGMRIFWSWIAPGARTRAQALAEDGRSLFIVAIGLTLSLFVSGIIEGFVTPSPLPWPVKIGIGALALAAFLVYMLVVGRRAARAGETGDLDPFSAGARRILAD
ncbi:stage II sporulation protein M [Amnibacterium sp. CER49]|uniref:stage II sporulation protein M n=1 Tax=Amnibacterium sp. CER49 TaxID=3039161 RepID=UPI0024474F48|nr:stage II sporulation protein M [Amnibacterium sp. CER49]MDH2442967.1 stage II sporulation protein M [Amnibacterium sp. CER49]